jgi:hypothetical protein
VSEELWSEAAARPGGPVHVVRVLRRARRRGARVLRPYVVEVRDDAGRVVHAQRVRRRATALALAGEVSGRLRAGTGLLRRPGRGST